MSSFVLVLLWSLACDKLSVALSSVESLSLLFDDSKATNRFGREVFTVSLLVAFDRVQLVSDWPSAPFSLQGRTIANVRRWRRNEVRRIGGTDMNIMVSVVRCSYNPDRSSSSVFFITHTVIDAIIGIQTYTIADPNQFVFFWIDGRCHFDITIVRWRRITTNIEILQCGHREVKHFSTAFFDDFARIDLKRYE